MTNVIIFNFTKNSVKYDVINIIPERTFWEWIDENGDYCRTEVID